VPSSPDNIIALFPDLNLSTAASVLTNVGQLASPAHPMSSRRDFAPFRSSMSAFELFYHMGFWSKREDEESTSPAERANAKGYSDGLFTAKIFALVDYSKLGFVGQYVNDSIVALGPAVIAAGTESNYKDGFMKGLEEGETRVKGILKV
jgi:glucan 1,3-beta-glucosidase